MMKDAVRAELAPGGVLRAGINLGNPLLVTGRTANGDPVGVSPDMARAIAADLGVDLKLVPYPSPGLLADAMAANAWDIGMIAVEPARAETIAFTAAYVQIEATYLVREGAPFHACGDVDASGVRIAISARSAYDLYLTRRLKHAELVRGEGLAGAVQVFTDENCQALAGLRPALIEDREKLPGTRLLPDMFTSVQQAVGCNPNYRSATQYLSDFVEAAKADGRVQLWIDRHGVTGRLMPGDPR